MTTRTGDQGYTGLLGKGRVAKYDTRIEAIGTLDEANAFLGLSRATCGKPRVGEIIFGLQKDLYVLMAELATPPENYDKVDFKIRSDDVLRLEALSDEIKAQVPIRNEFVVPGGTQSSATLDVARTVVRRAERHVVKLIHDGAVSNPEIMHYLNRLSDLVFILARYEDAGIA